MPAMSAPEEPEDRPTADADGTWDDDELADEMSIESFPTSDPPSTWAGHDQGTEA